MHGLQIITERNSGTRKLQQKTIATSVAAVVLAILFGFLIKRFSTYFGWATGDLAITGYTRKDLPQLIASLMPSDIFEPFKLFSPYPLILLSLLIIIALRSVDTHFDQLKDAVDACYVLFSKMLNLVMLGLPIFCFLSFL
ncbi:MAG: cation:dicarboxylase symporter family transporter, partial [Clostridia bacterium]|nr:cation:dicarboxylase symporter family transporter [Clostridia bacterium]